jgi:hypothetical protein
MATKVLTGGCLCGHIRFEAKGIPQKPHTCSCGMCRKHSGGLTLTWVEYPRADVKWTGKGGKPRTWRSSDFSSRAFCPKCGSTLGALDDNPVVALTTGAFDKPQLLPLKPEYHAFKGARPKWWNVEIKS